VALQFGLRPAGVSCSEANLETRGTDPSLELNREEQVRELPLLVGLQGVVSVAVPVQIVELNLAPVMGRARYEDEARAPGVRSTSGARRAVSAAWPRWVGAELELEALLGA